MGYGPVHILNNGQSNAMVRILWTERLHRMTIFIRHKTAIPMQLLGTLNGLYSVQTDNNGRQYLFRLCVGDFSAIYTFIQGTLQRISLNVELIQIIPVIRTSPPICIDQERDDMVGGWIRCFRMMLPHITGNKIFE